MEPSRTCHECLERVPISAAVCPHCGAPALPQAKSNSDEHQEEVVGGNFRLDGPIGRGSMGTIYRAKQLSLGKTVVLKILHNHLMDNATQLGRFEQEARAASMLAHPNVIQIIDLGRCKGGAPYIAMEYIPGRDLCELLYQDFPIDHLRVIKIATQICCALDEAHANGVLHRDLKPENIMVSNRRNMRDFVKVLDFGIAKLLQGNRVKTMAGMVNANESDLT